MSNFNFLPPEFTGLKVAAKKAEDYIVADPRTACFHARFALETIVHWLYRHDKALSMPYDQNLGALLHEPSFQNLVPEAVFQKTRVIQKMGNQAAHSQRPIRQYDAVQVVKELHHFCYWLARTYAPDHSREDAAWNDANIPQPQSQTDTHTRDQLKKLEEELAEQNKKALEEQKKKDELDAELQALRQQLAAVRVSAEAKPDTHDYSEAETRDYLIDVELRRAGWALDKEEDTEFEVSGMPNSKGVGYVDYVLWGDDGKPLGLVEAKKTTVDPEVGKQQAKLYADCLEAKYGQRPIIFYTNGYKTWMWDDAAYPPRKTAGFLKKAELSSLIIRKSQRQPLDVSLINEDIAERYYQKRAIGNLFEQFQRSRRKGLLVMATGTGKTRTAIALIDALQRAGYVKRALFLADRVSLVNQACNAFKTHLPESSPVNLVTEKNTDGLVYVCTYPTMMGLIDKMDGAEARFGIGHFDIIVIDEAHRSVYEKYSAIFEYFDSLLVGLTATPKTEVDKNTYDLFDLESGVPTDAYELETAVQDKYLVPYRAEQINLRFPQDGIDYESLSPEEREHWESLDWGDDSETTGPPSKVHSAAINKWLFNKDTVDKALQHLMENGHKVDGGDRLAKTIIFARNHEHAQFIEERFNHHYPQYSGHFARVIDNYVKYSQSLIDDFTQKDKGPHIAISVDMLDTGIDVPEVANLVFFKPVYSKTKFWQMIGRGTRLCPDLFGPGEDKTDFCIFDFCFNFAFFGENPEGISSTTSPSLNTRLFQARVDLLQQLQQSPGLKKGPLCESLQTSLHAEVASMNADNFTVRLHREAVDRFKHADAWSTISDGDVNELKKNIASLPCGSPSDDIASRRFDMLLLRMQIALCQGNSSSLVKGSSKVMDMASALEEKTAIPMVKAQIEFIRAIQDAMFWEGINLETLEDVRVRIRELVVFLDKTKKRIIYSDFKDEILEIKAEDSFETPSMTSTQYAKKVEAYLREHMDNIVIHRLRMNEPLTPSDLNELEAILVKIGENNGSKLLQNLLSESQAPSLPYFVRSVVGMDRKTAQESFSRFLSDQSLKPAQIRFIELIIDQLSARGVIEADALYEPPFNSIHSGGPEALFAGNDKIIEGVFDALASTQPKVLKGQ